jgi:hypothetical protein
MAKFVTEGLEHIGDTIFGTQAVDATLYLGVYENTTEPAITATMADIEEHSGDGYARLPLTRGTWTVTDNVSDYAEQRFQASGGDWGDQYGYFITVASAGTGAALICVEDFSDGPYDIKDGHSVLVTPQITMT